MKVFRRFFCAFFSLCLLFVSSSVIANAEELDTSKLKIYHYHTFDGSSVSGASKTFYPNNGEDEKLEKNVIYYGIRNTNWLNTLRLELSDSDVLINEGENAHIKINNLYYSMLVKVTGSDYSHTSYITEPTAVTAQVVFTDGTRKSFTDDSVSFVVRSDKTINIDFKFYSDKDVQQVYLYMKRDTASVIPYYNNVNYDKSLTFYCGEYQGDDKYQLSIDIQSEEAGLLTGILAFIESIFDKVGDIFDAIVELPGKIWNLIETGLKSLFVPSEAYIIDYKDAFDNMLETRLGCVYQSITILYDTVNAIQDADSTNSITLPPTTISLSDSVDYTFGGYDVVIVPEGFEFLADMCKMIVGIVATFAILTSLKTKFLRFIEGVGDSVDSRNGA